MNTARVGITGHTRFGAGTEALIATALRRLLADVTPLVGVSCLAAGSDQLFAEAVLELGGRLEVVLPAADYRETKIDPVDRSRFDRLLGRASTVRVLDMPRAGSAAYRVANETMIAAVDRLVAVWDGDPDDRSGSTADTVLLAGRAGVPVTTVPPDGAVRMATGPTP